MVQLNRAAKPRRGKVKLPKQRDHKPAMQPHLHARQRLASHLEDAIGSCEDLFAEHGETCACELCCLVSNLVGTLRIFAMLVPIT
jgi:hypothetical protein